MTIATVYKIECATTKRVYVGSSISLANRWKCHRHLLRKGMHHSPQMQSEWAKYGEDDFSLIVIETCEKSAMYAREKHWIDALQATSIEHGYNMCPVPGSRAGLKHLEETKKKISAAHKGRKKSEEHRRKIIERNRGRVTSDETKRKLSIALTGRKWSDEQRANSVGCNVGWHHSQEAKERIRALAIGRVATPETRAKISAAGMGRKWTERQRQLHKMRDHGKRTDEQRAWLSKARGGKRFVLMSKDGGRIELDILNDVRKFGLDPSNVQKCLAGKAIQTKGYKCWYQDAPELLS